MRPFILRDGGQLESRPSLASSAVNSGFAQGAFRASAAAFALTGALAASPAFSQSSKSPVSQAVVQPLPPAGVSELNSALRRLARNSRNVDALVDAGNASIKVNDIDAAIGFFGRAEELSPGNPQVKIGLAAAYVRKQRPLDALQLFDAAEAAGATVGALAGERGLAYDLVGDNASAQAHYQQALSLKENGQIRRRLALSYAMAGNRSQFEKVLRPLIDKEDFASYRTRAFGLAILGEEAEAVAIAEAVMPRNLSARIAPYLRYMPRLTKAQQAGAANLGIFPRAAQIGRDAPQIAQYTANPGARLTPRGVPLGRREDKTSPRRRPDRGRSAVERAPAKVEATPEQAKVQFVSGTPQTSAQTNAPKIAEASKSPVVKPQATPAVAEQVAKAEVVVAETKAPVVLAVQKPATVLRAVTSNEPPAAKTVEIAKAEVVKAVPITKAPQNKTPVFDLAQAGRNSPAVSATPKPVVAKQPSVADAFANFGLASSTRSATPTGGVDITTIKPPREISRVELEKAAPEPKAPVHPKRYWVQIATGRDRSALKFDWRRIGRKSPDVLAKKSSFVAKWGQTNRLLAGPYGKLREAQAAVTALKKDGVDSFTFTSAEGQEIDSLK